VAIGADNVAMGDGAVALGNLSSAIGDGSVAIGNGANSGTDGVAIGNGASTGAFSNSVALGAGMARDNLGSYDAAWYVAGGLCIVAAGMSYRCRQRIAAEPHQPGRRGLSSQIGGFGGTSNLYDLRDQDRKI
jgi:hypothetical protein